MKNEQSIVEIVLCNEELSIYACFSSFFDSQVAKIYDIHTLFHIAKILQTLVILSGGRVSKQNKRQQNATTTVQQ